MKDPTIWFFSQGPLELQKERGEEVEREEGRLSFPNDGLPVSVSVIQTTVRKVFQWCTADDDFDMY